MKTLIIISATVLLAPLCAFAQTISGRVVDIDGAAIQGIIVGYNLQGNLGQDTTDANGDYFLDFSTTTVPEEDIPVRLTTWGKLKAGFGAGSGKAAPTQECIVFPDTLYFDGSTVTAEPHYWSIRHAFSATGGIDIVNAATVPFVVTIPNGWDDQNHVLTGPGDVAVIPLELRDVWDLNSAYDGFTGWHPDDFPVQTVNYNVTAAEWTAAKTVMLNWEAMTGFDFYDIQEIYPPTEPKSMKFIHGSPQVQNFDSDGDGYLDSGNILINTTSYMTINHEAGFRALTGNGGCAVYSYAPSNFSPTGGPIVPRDIAYVRITYLLQRLVVDGHCYANPYREYRDTP